MNMAANKASIVSAFKKRLIYDAWGSRAPSKHQGNLGNLLWIRSANIHLTFAATSDEMQ